jgi:hypothetical protein
MAGIRLFLVAVTVVTNLNDSAIESAHCRKRGRRSLVVVSHGSALFMVPAASLLRGRPVACVQSLNLALLIGAPARWHADRVENRPDGGFRALFRFVFLIIVGARQPFP